MQDLLSKEHYCYRTNTLLMKALFTPSFLQENLDPPFYDFFKNPDPPINKGGFTL